MFLCRNIPDFVTYISKPKLEDLVHIYTKSERNEFDLKILWQSKSIRFGPQVKAQHFDLVRNYIS
jgi:hypothetical protein